ncbi:VIT1/CCC1 transporter family protein [Hydrogenimonas urashimensis]|uniref:VIT1/CCC1 transporter family protein n=1 Tax=Hydrogenimonas urashimensis TaxID=2740515 RepID=UPI001F47A504|nr:VIT1/CCC1 family protein [Hydrogenimonas urashimensis]
MRPRPQMNKALRQQQNEIDDYLIYTALSRIEKDQKNKKILKDIAAEEKRHYEFWKKITRKERKARRWIVVLYALMARYLGTSFALKLLERREEGAEEFYRELFDIYPEAKTIYEQESHHEKLLIDMLSDRKLLYAGAIVLGMNDALVELTGTLSGIALAFDKSALVGITGLIMGIAASLSMAGSAYLESKESPAEGIDPAVYALYTGIAYIFTTILLVGPFFLFETTLPALLLMFAAAVAAIVLYNFYISVARDQPFWKRLKEMSLITFGVALVSFGIGYTVRTWFGIDI